MARLRHWRLSPPCSSQAKAGDDYPNRPITLVIPLPPGGTNDIMARAVSDKMSAALGQQHRDREPQCRRQRHGRHARSRTRRAGRLHDHSRLYVDARHRPASLPRCRLRSAQGFGADRADRVGAGAASRLQGFAGAQCRRTDRDDEERQGAGSGRDTRASALSIISPRFCSHSRLASRSSKSSRKARTR